MDFNINIKKVHESAILPQKMSEHAAGLDIFSYQKILLPATSRMLVSIGLAMSFPPNYVCFVKDRSGLAAKHGITTLAGVIDADYRGEYKIMLYNTTDKEFLIESGDRIAQLVFLPLPEFTITQVDSLEQTSRGEGGFGSTGK